MKKFAESTPPISTSVDSLFGCEVRLESRHKTAIIHEIYHLCGELIWNIGNTKYVENAKVFIQIFYSKKEWIFANIVIGK